MNFVCLMSVTISLYFFNGNATILKAQKRHCHGKIFISSVGSRHYKGLSHDVKKTKIPSRFDARKKWPRCKSLFRISDQGYCSGCWAFSSASVMADRLCIHSKQKLQDYVSTQDLLECCKWCVAAGDRFVGGCKGGYPEIAFDFWRIEGIVTGFDRPQGCKPINKKIVEGIPSKTCQKQCTNKKYKKSYNNSKTFGLNVFLQRQPLKKGLKQIQIELMKNGPVVAILNIYEYFVDYGKNAVISYNKKKVRENETAELHAVKIIGWDLTKRGTPVWIIANSWGDKWCDSGFCRMKRGVNELNIEEYPMIAGLPRLQPASSKRAISNMEKIKIVSSGSSTFVSCLSFGVILTLLFLVI